MKWDCVKITAPRKYLVASIERAFCYRNGDSFTPNDRSAEFKYRLGSNSPDIHPTTLLTV